MVSLEKNKIQDYFEMKEKIRGCELDINHLKKLYASGDISKPVSRILTNGMYKSVEKILHWSVWYKNILDKGITEQKTLIDAFEEIESDAEKAIVAFKKLPEDVLVPEFLACANRIFQGDSSFEGILNSFSTIESYEELWVIEDYYIKGSLNEKEATMLASIFETSDRGLSYFQAYPKDLEIFKAFKKTHHDLKSLITGGIEMCENALLEGATKIAKNGIKTKGGMERKLFDVTILDLSLKVGKDHMNNFNAFNTIETKLRDELHQKIRWNSSKSIEGVYVLLIPYFALPFISKYVNQRMEIHEIVKVNDKGILALIATNSEPDLIYQNRVLKAAYNAVDRLPLLEDVEETIEFGSDVEFPSVVRAEYLDAIDHLRNIEGFELQNKITEHFRVKESITSLSRPIQEYKTGHLPAVATLGLGDGVQDESVHPQNYEKGNLFPHIYTAKMSKFEYEQEDEIIINEQEVTQISQLQRAVITIAIRDQYGKNTVLLDTSQNVTVKEMNAAKE